MPLDLRRVIYPRDALVAVGMALLGLFAMLVSFDHLDPADLEYDPPSRTTATLLLMPVVLPLAWRRIRPAAVLMIVTVFFVIFRVIQAPEGTVTSVALFLAIYSVGAWEESAEWRTRSRALAIGLSVCTLGWSLFSSVEFVNTDAVLAITLTLAFNTVFFVAAWMMGDLARTRRENEAELARRADELAAEREVRAQRAVVDERVRIARELHDVVAHHVSVMGVQAGAARRILTSDPTRASQALEAIEESGRQAVGELQKLVGFLRAGNEVDSTGPQPTLEDVDKLFEQIGVAGLPVEKRVIGHPRAVPDSVALSAYRIIQESLTNALKHAGPVPTAVILTYTKGSLDVEVVNRRGVTQPNPGGGRGLVGMRERVSMLGGSFSSGMSADGGYRVAASLPTGTAYDASAVGE